MALYSMDVKVTLILLIHEHEIDLNLLFLIFKYCLTDSFMRLSHILVKGIFYVIMKWEIEIS